MDPLQRLVLMCSYEALEMAGYSQPSPSVASKRVSTYIGQVTDDWRYINGCQGIDNYYIPGITRAFFSGRINYHFKWEGASYNLDAACASSSTAISLACSALLARNYNTAVAGGGSILAAPRDFAGLSKGGFLSPTKNCKAFHDSTDGYCCGEGIGVVVLKRLEDAIAEKDSKCFFQGLFFFPKAFIAMHRPSLPISQRPPCCKMGWLTKSAWSEIRGVISRWARTYSAKASSITQPHAETQAALYKVLEQACALPQDIGYVEMHGTGT